MCQSHTLGILHILSHFPNLYSQIHPYLTIKFKVKGFTYQYLKSNLV